MKRILLLLLFPIAAHAQNSSLLKSASKYMPTLSEVGFVTGAINCYVQTASLVRAVNKEIAYAKSMAGRLDQLKDKTEEMYDDFKALGNVNPYNMDSWASWLDRADGLVSEETDDFVDILFHSVLTTLDTRMITGFYDQVQKGLSYDTRQGDIAGVLRSYYMGRDYENNMEKVHAIAVNAIRVSMMIKQVQLLQIQQKLSLPGPVNPALVAKEKALKADIAKLEGEIANPSVGGSTEDRQISFLMEQAQGLGSEFSILSEQLSAHQKDLRALNDEWVMAAKNKLPKDKSTSVQNTATPITRGVYDPNDADKAPVPTMDADKPSKSNVSHTGSPTSLADLAQLQNKIEFKRLEMAEAALQMELMTANARASLLAIDASQKEAQRNARTNTTFGSENLAHAMEAVRKERGP
jgi:hypothetical protein